MLVTVSLHAQLISVQSGFSSDSMMIGEPQILGQIKTAYGYACEYKTVGTILNRFLHKAFSVAKRVRNETAIASNAVSVSFAAVELARKYDKPVQCYLWIFES